MATVQKFRWFWAWNDEKEEQWLRENALEGMHLVKANPFGNYIFEGGPARDDVYRLDYVTSSKDKDEYYQLFADAGWEHVGEMSGWQYFRKENQEGEELEIFTDTESKSKKYQRILLYLIIFLPIMIIFMDPVSQSEHLIIQAISLFFFAIMLVYVYAMVRLIVRIGQLKRKL